MSIYMRPGEFNIQIKIDVATKAQRHKVEFLRAFVAKNQAS